MVLDLAFGPTSAIGGSMGNVTASFAEYERRLISDRISAAFQAKANGHRLGGARTTSGEVIRARHAGASPGPVTSNHRGGAQRRRRTPTLRRQGLVRLDGGGGPALARVGRPYSSALEESAGVASC